MVTPIAGIDGLFTDIQEYKGNFNGLKSTYLKKGAKMIGIKIDQFCMSEKV